MSAYTDICKQRCEGCRKLIPMLNRPWSPITKHRFEYCDDPDDDFLCTAPTPEQVIEEQHADLNAMRAREEWMFGQGNGASWVDLHRYMSQSNNIEQARALIDADIANVPVATLLDM